MIQLLKLGRFVPKLLDQRIPVAPDPRVVLGTRRIKMNFLPGLTLVHRVLLGYGLVLTMLAGSTVLSLQHLGALSSALDEVVVKGAERTQAIHAMERTASQYALTLRKASAGELADAAEVLKSVAAVAAAFDTALERATLAMGSSGEAAALLGAIARSAASTREVEAEALKAAEGRGIGAQFFQLREAFIGDNALKWNQRQDVWQKALVAASDWDRAQHQVLSQAAAEGAEQARLLLVAGALVALLVGVIMAFWVQRDLRQGLALAIQAIERLAKHDLSQPIVTRRDDELGQVARSLETVRVSLNGLAAGVRDACCSITTASGEISQGSQDLSGRTEAAASTLQNTVTATRELVDMLDQTMRTASSAGSLAEQAQSVANRGGSVVAEAISTMSEIDQSSRKIADIISIIDGIAFQTNILALNAAVEAARAGEQGRGFAVVASEVRALAQRSAAAAREIKELIQASLDKVRSGSTQVKNAGGATEEIMNSVQRVAQLIHTLSSEAGVQRQGVQNTNASVSHLDELAHQNAALAEQSAAAAASLLDQANRLSVMVDSFKLEAPPARS